MKKFLFATLSVIILATTLVGQEISFNLTPEEEAEKNSWISKGLMYPKYGYDKVSWGDGVDEVKKHYTGLVNTSDEDSLFGMRKFSQKVNSGGMVKREFYFYQGGLIKVEVQYDKSVKAELIKDKIESTYGEDAYPNHAHAWYYSPSKVVWNPRTHSEQKGGFLENDPKHWPDCYTVATYRHETSFDIEDKIIIQRIKLENQRKDNAKKKQMGTLDL
jgi:hypothetical protein